MPSDRIELESKVAMLEHTVDALSGELHEHAKTIQSLQQQVRQLAERLRSKSSEPDMEPHDSPPPHYHGG